MSVIESVFTNVPEAAHLGKRGLYRACFPRNLRTAIFRNISEQLFQLLSQTNFSQGFARHHAFFAVFGFLHFCVGVYLRWTFA